MGRIVPEHWEPDQEDEVTITKGKFKGRRGVVVDEIDEDHWVIVENDGLGEIGESQYAKDLAPTGRTFSFDQQTGALTLN